MNEERSIFSADLHIHTPSSRCFKGEKNDDSYFEILKKAKSKDLSIIAITDHNSIEGYKKLFELKENIREELKVLESINDSKQASKKIKELNTLLNYFQDLLIIPGVEFEVNNGIHILCLFNPETPISKIEEFLNNGGYEKDDYGFEIANKISKWDIFHFFEETKQYDCIVIDAHTDSDKGILETLKNGLPRAHCLSNSRLNGLCYKSEKQRSLLEKTLQNSVDYQRDIPLAFLKSSDAHTIDEVGGDTTYFQLKSLDFRSFKDSFSNPLEYISTTIPVVKNIVEKILNTGKCIASHDINSDLLKQYLCAFHNTTGGFIVLGVNEHGGIIGYNYETIENSYKTIIESINSLPIKIDCDINSYPVQNDKFIIIINVKKGTKLVDIDRNGAIWSFENKKIRILSAEEIERNIEKRVTDLLQKKIVNRLKKIESESLEIKNTLFSYPIIQKFEKSSKGIYSIISEPKYKKPLKLSIDQKESIKQYAENKINGKSKGNIFFFYDFIYPRLTNAYLRISIPKYYLKGVENYTKKNEQIIVVPGGATFYSFKAIDHYNEHQLGIITFNSIDQNYSNKFLCCFLKSSFFLWYFNFKFETVDFFAPEKFKLIQTPLVYIKNHNHKRIVSRIEELFDIIISKENAFLQIDIKPDAEDYEEIIENHNAEIADHSHEIDLLFYELIDLTSDEVKIIESSLSANNLYVPLAN